MVRWALPTCSSLCLRVVSCRPLGLQLRMNIVSTLKKMLLWNDVSSLSRLMSQVLPIRLKFSRGLRKNYEDHHRVTITDKALQSAAELSARYIQDRHLPDKAIDLIDEAGARLRIRRLTAPPELKEMDKRITELKTQKDDAIAQQDFEKAASLRDEQETLETKRKNREQAWREGESDVSMVVDEEVIAQVISSTTGYSSL